MDNAAVANSASQPPASSTSPSFARDVQGPAELPPEKRQQLQRELDQPYSLTEQQKQFYREQGYVKLKQVLSPEVIDFFGGEITRQVIRLNKQSKPMSQRTTYEKAFLQITNIWRQSDIAREFVFSKRLAKIAADLMGVKGVRLYHDQALYKEPSGGVTPWHADQYYWPLSNPNCCTVWAPLQATPKELGPLAFSATSQRYANNRDIEISDESEKRISKALLEEGLPLVEEPFDLGEVSFHSGWTFHRAGPNISDRPRAVMTIIYMEDGIKLIAPRYKAHQADWDTWMPGAQIGQTIATPLNPVLYP